MPPSAAQSLGGNLHWEDEETGRRREKEVEERSSKQVGGELQEDEESR